MELSKTIKSQHSDQLDVNRGYNTYTRQDIAQVVSEDNENNALSVDHNCLNSPENCKEGSVSHNDNENSSLEGLCTITRDPSGSGVENLSSIHNVELSDKNSSTPTLVISGDALHKIPSEVQVRKRWKKNGGNNSNLEMVDHRTDDETSFCNDLKKNECSKIKDFSLLNYLKVEVTRNYLFEDQGEKYTQQMEKVYTFMKTPRELEKLMWFGFLLCLDCFLFVFTYLPIRLFIALFKLFGNIICLRFLKDGSLLESYQLCDLLRGFILIVCCTALDRVDLSVLYHIVRGQSVIKLYVIYNMLDIADRLFSSIGQDTLDALFSTAAEPKKRRRMLMVLMHFGLASLYVYLHAILVLFQAITLNVAINSHNKVLMVVMISNQFVELKGCVFKKFEKNNLFQMSCADIRERFYYVVLVSLVALRNMHELHWNLDHLNELMPSIGLLLSSEIFVDWIKHGFITKFNCISSEKFIVFAVLEHRNYLHNMTKLSDWLRYWVYREYRELLAFDATTSRLFEQRAGSDHFNLVSRRLGFIPLPLGCLVYRVTSQSVKISGGEGIIVLILTYLWLTSLKVLISIILLGLSCRYVNNKDNKDTKHSHGKNTSNTSPSPSQHVVDPLDRGSKKSSGIREVKALNEIDRYTLCSNRIV